MAHKVIRRGELAGSGPVRYKIDAHPGGAITASVTIDYEDAPVPEHYYVADYFEVTNFDPEVLFVFGKLASPGNEKLRNKVEIYFPGSYFINQFWKSSSGDFRQRLKSFLADAGYKPITPKPITEATEKVQTVHSNNAYMVQAGTECMIDFFFLSPRDLALKAQKGKELVLEPLVRVLLTANLLLGLLDACEPIAATLAPRFEAKENAHAAMESQRA